MSLMWLVVVRRIGLCRLRSLGFCLRFRLLIRRRLLCLMRLSWCARLVLTLLVVRLLVRVLVVMGFLFSLVLRRMVIC